MNLIVNEPIRSIHLTPCLTIGTLECILSFKSSAASRTSYITMHTHRKFRCSQSREPSQFSRIDFLSDIGRHVNRRVFRFSDEVMCHRQRIRLDSDLDIAVDGLAGYGGGSKAGIDG